VGARLSNTDRGKGPVPDAKSARSGIGGLWVGLVLSALVLIILLIFILQNPGAVRIAFLGWDGTLPAGVALLFAAVAGVLLVAIPGSMRMVQLRRQARQATGADREPQSRP
jgi:lipopolysaccharide assembly protein A